MKYIIEASEQDMTILRGMLDFAISTTKSSAIEDTYHIHKLLNSAKKIDSKNDEKE